jgi:hypothetical protein
MAVSSNRFHRGSLGFRSSCTEVAWSMKQRLDHFAFLGAVLDWASRVILIVAVTLILVQASDRAPPFEVFSYEPVAGRPGETVVIRAKVRRDIDRGCSASMSRSFFDASNARADVDTAFFTAQFLADMEADTPGRMAPTLTIPATAACGGGVLVSSLAYTCNRVHSWGWPIPVTTRIEVNVLC